MNRLRSTAAVLLGVLCIAGLLYGVIMTYATRILFDPVIFSARVADSLAEPPVARVVANQITEQIVNYQRELTPYRPIVLGAVQQIVASPPFRALVRQAARKLHPIFIKHGADLSLTLMDVQVIVKEALAANPALAGKLPSQAKFVLGSRENWPTGKLLMKVVRLGQRFQRRALMWIGAGFVFGALGLFSAPRKDRYLLGVGLGLTVSAFLLAAFANFGGSLLAPFARTEVGGDLLRGLWPVFVGPLALRMIILAGLGIVLTASVTTLLERIDAPATLNLVWRVLRHRPSGATPMILRGLALIAAGVIVALHPIPTLQVVAVLAGSFLLFVGLQDVFTTATRFAGRAAAADPAVAKTKGRLLLPSVAAILVLALLVGSGAYWLMRDPAAPQAFGPRAIVAVNGYPELRDRKLNDVVFPTTHNSMSAASLQNWMFANQERSIEDQLEDGVRGFLIDIHYGDPVQGRIRTVLQDEVNSVKKYEAVLGKEGLEAAMRIRNRLVGEPDGERDIYLAHGFCELGATRFVETLHDMKDYMETHPDEVIIIVVQDEGVKAADVATAFDKSGLIDFVYKGPVTSPWPTLGDMVAKGERVVVYAENDTTGVPWYHLMLGNIQETPYGFHSPEEFSCRPNRGGRKGSLFLINHWIETAPASKPSNAAIVNAYPVLLKRARQCRRERKMVPNLLAVDFYRTGDLFKVARALNGIPEPESTMVAR
jgi:hypothetical protein